MGKLVKERAEFKGLSLEEVGKLIGKTRQNVADIYKRKSLDTDLIVSLSTALGFDFLAAYYEEDSMRPFRVQQLQPFELKIAELKSQLKERERRILDLEKINAANEKLIKLLEEKRT